MAVIDELKLEASVKINGTTTAEFDDPEPVGDDESGDDYPLRCSKYIECIGGAEFTVCVGITGDYDWLDLEPSHGLAFRVNIDGKRVAGPICEQNGRVPGHQWKHEIKGREVFNATSPTAKIHAFRFATVNSMDDSDKSRVKADVKRAKHLGMIEIKVRRVKVGHVMQDASSEFQDEDFGDFSIAEKALKGRAVSHGTSFAPAFSKVKPTIRHCDNVDSRPIAVFTFKYRSREALKGEMIISRSPSPELGMDGLGADEITRLAQERLKQLKNEKALKRQRSIKRESQTTYDLTGDSQPERPFKVVKLEDGQEMIDLTDD